MKTSQGEKPSLEGRRALVVGGSGGIGRAVSLELGARGAYVVVHGGSSREKLDSTLRELRLAREPELATPGLGAAGSEGFLLDLGDPASGLARLSDALPGLGDIDILVVAFGPFVRKSLAATDRADWERVALLDLALPGTLCSACLPAMASRGWGRILLFGGSRTDGIRAYSSNAAYAAAKTGLAVLVKSVAAEGAPRGVGCVLVCPGLTDTEYIGEAEKAALRSRAPGGRLAEPAEIASAAVDLLVADPCLASGAIVTLDGGLSF
jgi:NAD(P)-dependent dehydrogenase (short-subunit alcohol dehydrogenase family)